ncbi:MAG TPA: hypothetical protein VHC22_12585 [Pirellulales bacterium]|nr:hypothetical protein [Pirellulales bacterium]
MKQRSQEGFSARVLLELIVDGKHVEISQVGNHRLWLRNPEPWICNMPAKLVITVGSTRKVKEIILSSSAPHDPQEFGYW